LSPASGCKHRWAGGPLLGAMAGVLVALLVVEGVTAMLGFSQED
jgi:hypothetical protein